MTTGLGWATGEESAIISDGEDGASSIALSGGGRARLITDRRGVAALAADWRALPQPVAAPTVVTGPDYLLGWLDTLGRRSEPRVVALHEGERLVGVLPLVATTLSLLRGGRQISLAGSRRPPVVDLADPMVIPGRERRLAEGAAALLERRIGDWDSLYLGNIAGASATFTALIGECERRGWTFFTRARSALVLDSTGDWQEFRAALPRSVRRLPRRLDQLRQLGEVRVELALAGAAGAAALEELFALYRERWGPGNWLEDPDYRACLRRMWSAHQDSGARIAGIWLDDRPLAMHLIFRQGNRDQSLLVAASRDPRVASKSPGGLLDYLTAERAFGDDTEEIHLLHTMLPAKLVWTTRVVPELIVTALSPRARLGASGAVALTEFLIGARNLRRSRLAGR